MRELFLVISILVLLFVGGACSSDSKYKIGFLQPNLVDDRMKIDRQYFVSKVSSLGGEAIVADAQFNDQLQINQAKELISQGVKALVIMPVNKNTAAAIVRYAHDNNVKVIAYERIISNCDLDYYLSFDNVKVGELMASYAVKVKPEGDYVILSGDKSDQNAVWVREGMLKTIDPLVKAGKINVVYSTYIEDWSGDNAYMDTRTYLKLSMKVPDVILSAYDGMSRGSIKALEENEIESYPVITGQNAELLSCRYIVQGKQSMTVYKSLKTEAESAAELAMKCARGEKVETNQKVSNGMIDVPSMLIEPISVDANNMKNTVIKDQFLKEDEVYTNAL